MLGSKREYRQWSCGQVMTDHPITVTIYHNPACGTSRNTLALIRAAGIEPTIIEYLKTPPDRDTLNRLLGRLEMRPRDLLREKGTPYAQLDLGASHWSDEQLVDQMLAHPILINRPIVVAPGGVRLCRPSEVVLDILPVAAKGPFAKENGEQVLDAQGRRVPRALDEQ
jgi:arsenate reductase